MLYFSILAGKSICCSLSQKSCVSVHSPPSPHSSVSLLGAIPNGQLIGRLVPYSYRRISFSTFSIVTFSAVKTCEMLQSSVRNDTYD